MDRRKAALKSLMKGALAKREKRIESPFVRYNDLDQAVCKVCDVIIKSEPLWAAHITGRAHKEAVALLKVRLAAGPVSGAASGQSSTSLPSTAAASSTTTTSSKSSGGTRLASELPTNFFEEPQKKHHRAKADDSTRASASFPAAKVVAHSQKTAPPSSGAGVEIRTGTAGLAKAAMGPPAIVGTSSGARGRSSFTSAPAQPDWAGSSSGGRSMGTTVITTGRERVAKELPAGFFDNDGGQQKPRLPGGGAQQNAPSRAVSGRTGETTAAGEDAASTALPEGFFDDVAADHKARGLEMKKVVIQYEVKEFMTMIQRDVHSIELREEEEEYVAAEEREEREEFEHRSFLERMAALKKAKEEKSRQHLGNLGGGENGTVGKGKTKSGTFSESEDDDDNDDEDDDDLLFDWRAKTL